MGCGFSSSSGRASRRVHVRSANNPRKVQRLCAALDHSDDVESVKAILSEQSPTGSMVNLEAPVFPLRDGSGRTHMLMYAAKSGRVEVVKHLLAEGFKCTATEVVDAEADDTL